jgi:Glycine/sarcosine/betaine reductase selenoprotein B (GRDB).
VDREPKYAVHAAQTSAAVVESGAHFVGRSVYKRHEAFDLESKDGDLTYREIPVEVGAADLKYATKGYDTTAVLADRNSQIPIERLREYQENAVVGQLNNVWWSVSPFIPNAVRVARAWTGPGREAEAL